MATRAQHERQRRALQREAAAPTTAAVGRSCVELRAYDPDLGRQPDPFNDHATMGWTTLQDGTAKLDVRPFIEQMEGELRHGTGGSRREWILAALRRWQWDGMLDGPSRARARTVAVEFDDLETAAPGWHGQRARVSGQPRRGV